MRVAAIDIGTNTILMLVADVDQDGAIAPLHDEHAIARMGKGVDEHGIISRETIERVSDFLHRYKAIADSFNPTVISACGTSALRDAANAGELIDSVEQRTGIKIEVLNGHEEAELTYLGAISEFLKDDASRSYAVLDIGGGSTELTVGQGTTLTRSESINLGAVRLTERILKTSPPARNARVAANEEVKSWISKLSPPPPRSGFIGVAGTVTTLAAIELNLQSYDPKRVSGHFLGLETVEKISNSLEGMTVGEIMTTYPQIQAGRADVIYAGTLILRESLQRFGRDGIVASDRGLRYGIALREGSFERRNS